jgi:hypothetical protein
VLNFKIQIIVDELKPLLRHYSRSDYGIAVGGSHAKGTADKESDLDLYLFANSVMEKDKRAQWTNKEFPDIENLVSWGSDQPFIQGGTDFFYKQQKIECWIRSCDIIERTITECNNGVVKQDFVTWTPTGFYNHCTLSDLNTMILIDDPSDILSRWKATIAVYPQKLQKTIIQTSLEGARFWSFNFHYNSAIERQDVIYTSSIVQQVVHNIIQIFFAVNKVYFPGDKKLENALEHLDKLPDLFMERIHNLLNPGKIIVVDILRKQQVDLQQLLTDTEILVEEVMSTIL